MSENYKTAIIIDNGSGSCKFGFGDSDYPELCVPSLVGRLKGCAVAQGFTHSQDVYIGEEVQSKRGILKLSSPVEYGLITSIDDIQKIWAYGFNKLKACPNEHPILLTQVPVSGMYAKNLHQIAEIMFEEYQVPALYLSIPAVLALYPTGRTTGVVLDSGDGVTYAVPVHEGHIFPKSAFKIDVAGRHLTEEMMRLLPEIDLRLNSPNGREIARDIKEKICYVARNFMGLIADNSSKTINYTLPDGQVIQIGDQRSRCPEILFQNCGLQDLIWCAVQDSSCYMRRDLYKNIVLAGGNTLLPGIKDRLKQEMQLIVPPNVEVNIVAPEHREFSAWVGGAVASSLSSFWDCCLKQNEFKEYGSNVVYLKNFY